MLGFRFAPRIKTFSKNKIYTFDNPAKQPQLVFMIGRTIHVMKIKENWDDLLRLISFIRNGTATAFFILKKLAAYPRQNSLSVALREIGRIERTLYIEQVVCNFSFQYCIVEYRVYIPCC